MLQKSTHPCQGSRRTVASVRYYQLRIFTHVFLTNNYLNTNTKFSSKIQYQGHMLKVDFTNSPCSSSFLIIETLDVLSFSVYGKWHSAFQKLKPRMSSYWAGARAVCEPIGRAGGWTALCTLLCGG